MRVLSSVSTSTTLSEDARAMEIMTMTMESIMSDESDCAAYTMSEESPASVMPPSMIALVPK